MAFFQTHHTKITGLGAAVPSKVIETVNYETISMAEREMFVKTTGIAKRRMANPGTTTADLCFAAAEKMLNEKKIDRSEIDLLVFVTQSPDYLLPATSIIMQDRLKLGKHTMAFDVALGCSGYVYGLSIVSNLLETGNFRKALLLAGDISTHSQNIKDKTAYPLFGDAGTATLLEYTLQANTSSFLLNSDGSGYKAIIQPHGGLRNPITSESFVESEVEAGIVRTPKNLHMNGMDVFNFSIQEAPLSIQTILEKTNFTVNDIDYFVLHQANRLMNETIRKKIKVGPEKIPYSLHEYGNTSSASIPITIIHALRNEVMQSKRLCLCGFGVGLSWGTAIINVDQVYTTGILEIE